MAAHDVGQHRQLAAGDLDPGQLGPGAQADADLLEHLGVGLLHGDVVEQRDRVRPTQITSLAFMPKRSIPIVS